MVSSSSSSISGKKKLFPRLPRTLILGALSLSAVASSSAAASSAANYTTQSSSRRTNSLDSAGSFVDDNNTPTNNKFNNRWSISGSAAAFVSPPSAAVSSSTGNTLIRAKDSDNSNNNNNKSSLVMKRTPSPPLLAFTSSVKRSFGLSSSLNMSSSTQSNNNSANNKSSTAPPMHNFRNSLNHSWLNHLSPEDPTNLEKSLARSGGGGRGGPGRPVFNGHYVSVRPTPLKNPKLVIHSPQMLEELGFRTDEVESESFIKYFSGDVDGAFENYMTDAMDEDDAGMSAEKLAEKKEIETWATPYALSIMGRRYTNNCPYGTGDGYGDGRAISVGEILVPRSPPAESDTKSGEEAERNSKEGDGYPRSASRYELQLKGAGQTPFCRGADGRAVLRSSVREFLASEAMHRLGISTTRALSLIVSEKGDTSNRPWYSDGNASTLPSMDDPRLQKYDEKQRREIISQLAVQQKSDPDMLVEEKCAITTRVASSFVRIGHLDLFARRVEMLDKSSIKETSRYQELEDIMWHACYREYYNEAYAPFHDAKDAKGASLALMEGAMTRISDMVGGWVRVGFVQGNFNADNCLVGGRTMDYGPFGFLDVYHPLSAKWTGSGDHFGFMNQPNAGYANFMVLVESLLPIIDANGGDGKEVREDILNRAQSVFSNAVDVAMRSKMGLVGGGVEMEKEAEELWGEIEPLLRIGRGDWTLFWRQLTYVAAKYSPAKKDEALDYDAMMSMLLGEGNINPFYDALTDENRASLRAWIEKWHNALTKCYNDASKQKTTEVITPPEETMRLANPKYTLREWMLVEAYTKADSGKSPGNPFPSASGDYSGVHELFALCNDPYGEGSSENHSKYYRRAPDESLRAGGTAFMS